MASKKKPEGCENEIIKGELKGKPLINDLKMKEEYWLNEKSAQVWNLCDGTKSVSQISKQLSRSLKFPITEDFVLTIKGMKERQSNR